MLRRGICTALFLNLFVLVPALRADDAAALPVEIKASDPNVRYVGRFDMKDPAAPRANWSGSAVEVRFSGTALNIKIKATNGNGDHQEFQAAVDGKATEVLKVPNNGTALLAVAAGLPAGNHIAQIVKRNEGYQGTMQVLGLQLSEGGKLLPAVVPDKRIEIIGDSISAGYGNEDNDRGHHQNIANTNAYMTYGLITGRAFGADVVDLAWAGRKMSPNNTMPEIYDLTLSTEKSGKWDFSKWTAQVVLINLATNDFGGGVPDQAKWCGAYKDFIGVVRKNYPEAHIYLASGTMMFGDSMAKLKKYLASIQADLKDDKIHLIDFGTQDINKDGIGADWHPSVKTHEKMAAKFIAAIEKDLGWKQVEQK